LRRWRVEGGEKEVSRREQCGEHFTHQVDAISQLCMTT
jgi:hypothetical protein